MLTGCSLLRTTRTAIPAAGRNIQHGRSCARFFRKQRPHRARAFSSAAGGGGGGGGGSNGAFGATGAGAKQHALAPLGALCDELQRIAPAFEVGADAIDVVRGPAEFYAVLKEKILNARRRIYLSTLYIGKTEHELISTIRTALQNNPELSISFLADALRGTREAPDPTTASLLAPLIAEFGPSRVQIRLFHTPNLTGFRKKILPQRINEGWGLQHMKLYGVDDEIMLSGANLSRDYFTDRLDRYHVFRSKELTDYYERIYTAVSSISFEVQPSDDPSGYSMSWPSTNSGRSPLEAPKEYIANAAGLLGPLITAPQYPSTPASKSTSNTLVYPIFQLTPFFRDLSSSFRGVHRSTELPALTALLTSLRQPPFSPAIITFTAGYFNPSRSLVNLLLSSDPSSLTVIAASPWANGFYGSKGISGLLPPAYSLLCKRFLQAVKRNGLGERARLMEWRKGTVGEEGGWTYHAKGVWVTLPPSDQQHRDDVRSETSGKTEEGEAGPCITLIGSSNYTQRSYTLDLEANALVVTRDPGLQRRLKEEVAWLQEDAEVVDEEEYHKTERRVGIHVRVAMWITKIMGGAL